MSVQGMLVNFYLEKLMVSFEVFEGQPFIDQLYILPTSTYAI
jgi:hypothetical protein